MDPIDEEARRSWFRREILPLEAELRAYARRLVRSGAVDPEDLVHEVFARAMAVERWFEVDQPAAFLMRIARNFVIDTTRRQKIVAIDTVADLDLLGTADLAPDPEAVAVARDELRKLQQAIEALPTQCRRVFTLRKIYGLSHADIAERLGLSVSTVEKHLARGLRLCAERLARDPVQPVKRELVRSWRKIRE